GLLVLFKQKTAYEIFTSLEFRRVLFRSHVRSARTRCPAPMKSPRHSRPSDPAQTSSTGTPGCACAMWRASAAALVRAPAYTATAPAQAAMARVPLVVE